MGIIQDKVEGDIGSVPRCSTCNSERVVSGAWACWNPETGLWELETTLDHAHCHQCDDSTKLEWSRIDLLDRSRIRELNDRFRRHGLGRGSIMVTAGMQEKGGAFVSEALATVRSFDAFSKDNDPWGENDFGAFELEGEKIFFKIDAYNLSLDAGSENPANEALTHRVLTIMLASEY